MTNGMGGALGAVLGAGIVMKTADVMLKDRRRPRRKKKKAKKSKREYKKLRKVY